MYLGRHHTLNMTLEDVESQLDPQRFMRVNRQFIISAAAVQKLSTYFLGKMRIHMTAARIEFAYSVKKRADDGTETELCYGTTEHGFVDTKTFRPCNIKKRLPELYEKLNGNIKAF